jgi:hypothetical protein
VSAPAALRCARCGYLPASATIVCLRCRAEQGSMKKENAMHKTKLAALFLGVFIAGCAGMQPASTAADVPEKLKPGASESLAMVSAAKGVQIYECRASKDRAGEYDWVFIAPEADLFDAGGTKKIGRHYAGPHWEAADGSTIVGAVREHADAPVDGSIPWLLLSAKSVGPEGSFSRVTSVQRLHTVGGVAPKGCFQAEVGMQLRIGYSADYYFFTPGRPAPSASRDFDIGYGY